MIDSFRSSPSVDMDSDSERDLITPSREIKVTKKMTNKQVEEDLLKRYRQAKEAVSLLRKSSPDLKEMEEEKAKDDDELVDKLFTERGRSRKEDDFVYVKRSIQEFLNYQVLSLEKTNARLKMELQKNLQCMDQVTKRLDMEQKCRALTILAHMHAKKEYQTKNKAFNHLKMMTLVARTKEREARRLEGEKKATEREKLMNRVVRTQPSSTSQKTESQLIAQLRVENRRLQLELEDRSRAAELLCKRLLRVDAAARAVDY